MLLSEALPPRFWSKVDHSSGCWIWTASLNNQGYAMFGVNGRMRTAHRYAYEVLVGAVPSGLELDHLCRNRACVNPDHLEPVTRTVNVRRGLAPAVAATRHLAVTHCPQGHPYDAANTYIRKSGARQCRACHRIRQDKYNALRRKRRS